MDGTYLMKMLFIGPTRNGRLAVGRLRVETAVAKGGAICADRQSFALAKKPETREELDIVCV